MTGDEQRPDPFPEPGPVAEYRDPELASRFEAEPIPQHAPGFWAELEASLSGGAVTGPTGDRPNEPIRLIAGVGPASDVHPVAGRRWGAGRLLVVAAAILAVLGLGGAVLVGQNRSSSPVESATPSLEPAPDRAEDDSRSTQSTSTTVAKTTTSTPSASSTSTAIVAVDRGLDYFDDDVRVDSIGDGDIVAFTPDDAAVLVVDDAPGIAGGCEGVELLTLYVQDLATGERRPAMGQDATIETGGLELLVDPFGATPGEVGTRPVYGQEWCDGEPRQRWRGSLAANGQISMLDAVNTGGPGDPFAGRTQSTDGDLVRFGPTAEYVLVASGSSAEVTEIDADGERDVVVATLPEELTGQQIRAAAWSPDGRAIALGTESSLLLWSPWTGASQRFEGGSILELMFDGTGGRLAVVGDGTATVLTFGDRPGPVETPPRCSARIAFEPLSAARLSEQGLPERVAATVLAIDQAASDCDWAALARLTPKDFVADLGGGDPVPFWQETEAGGQSPMWYLRTLFRQPNIETDTDADGEPDIYLWPAIQQDDDCTLDEAERASAIALGLEPAAAEEACLVVGGYAGYRTTIDDTGAWLAFLAGE